MPTPEQAPDQSIYRLKVTLRDRPAIWRRLEVSGAVSLEKLHRILQEAFGWTNSHLHRFIVGEQVYSLPDFELDELDNKIRNERRTSLEQLGVKPKDKFVYHYDFGDDWYHEILVEKVLEKDPSLTYPRCTGGKRSGPPEDCGGIRGYERLQEVITDPDDDEYDTLMEWLGEGFDPELFNLEEINQQLKRVK